MDVRSSLSRTRLRPRLRGGTVRLRLTLLYGALTFASGAVLLVITAVLWGTATKQTVLQSSKVPIRILTITGLKAPVVGPALKGPANTTVISPARQRGLVVGQLQVLAAQQHSSDLHQLLEYSGLALAVMALGSVGVGWLAAGRILRPLRVITNGARDISASNLHARLALDRPTDELKELADTFDQLLGRLERSFQSQRQFAANASHELRTPLATMRASLDVALAKPDPAPPETVRLAERIHHELDRVDLLIDSFLALARAQSSGVTKGATLSLDYLVEAALAERAGDIADKGLALSVSGCFEAVVSGDEALLARLVANVLDNAVRHNDPGGWIRVTTAVAGGAARITVANGGPVLESTAVSELAQPFRRSGPERTGPADGFGLGLSIVAAIVDAHGGRLMLSAVPDGGLEVRIDLPLAVLALVGVPG